VVHKIKVLLPIIIATIVLGIFGVMYMPQSVKNKNLDFSIGMIRINNNTIKVEIADTPSDRQRWLTFREDKLPFDSAMLMVYDKLDLYSLWLLNIRFNLDLIWINNYGDVVYIAKNVSGCQNTLDASYCTYKNTKPARYIIAASAGFIDIHKISNDTKVHIISI
jgi:uncharacterized protein